MQKSYLEVIEQFILDTNTKHPGLSEAERFNKVVRLEGLEYDSFLFNAFKRVEKELDEIGVALNEYRKAGIAMDDPLNGEFLLGYHSQKMAYRHQWNAANDANEDEQVDNETV